MVIDPLVSVVVPAYNSEVTIDETLRSVRAQTYRNLEILVVNDGSSDGTSLIVEGHAREDARVRLFHQSNAGLAATRNRGIAEARGEYIAPIDADDLWMPTKIEKQMRAMLAGGPKVGLVYTWYARIDDEGRIISTIYRPSDQGRVFRQMCMRNLPGNGSSPLMRKQAVLEVGGYDPSLPACEDLKLYLQIAERYEFAAVAEFLTGYRLTSGSMSTDFLRIVRGEELVISPFRKAYPQYEREFREGRNATFASMLRRAVRVLDRRSAMVLAFKMFENDRWFAMKFLLRLPFMFNPKHRLKAVVFPNKVSELPLFLPPSEKLVVSVVQRRQLA